jgi:NAD-dependent dihydropyrimidine dehydrogenase PreA subunit
MAYVITDPCIDVKDGDCTTACPVDCIYEGGRMFVDFCLEFTQFFIPSQP